MLASRRVGLRAQIADRDRLGQCAEGMTQPLRDVQAGAALIVQLDGLPVTEGRRTHPNVDHDIQDPTGEALDVLRLTGRHIGEVDPAHRALLGHRDVHLLQIKCMPQGLGQHVLLEGLKEDPAIIRTKHGCE